MISSTLRPFAALLLLLSLPYAGLAQEADTSEGIPTGAATQPETPVSEWTGKTILVTGGHPDDDSHAYGTLSMLQENGNEIYVLIMTTGNVGTKDPDMTRNRLSQIRREEELEALSTLGIPEDHYINLGYTDGMLEFADEEEVVKRLVRHIREIQPNVLISFDPGWGYQVWHKTDHRAAAYLSADAARAAEWRLLFPGQINHEGLDAHQIDEYLFYDSPRKGQNVTVDISGEHAKKKVKAVAAHMSQFSSAWQDYRPELSPENRKEYMQSIRERILQNGENGKTVERFRYYRGLPDGIGKRRGSY
jgi:LmbE family N-acetylglucosaminyl deacetylase